MNCNFHLFSAVLPLVFPHSRQLAWVLPVQWVQYKQKISPCLCIHISARDVCWRNLYGSTHISLMSAVRTDAAWTNSASCWSAWYCWHCVAWCYFYCGTTSVSLLTTCAKTRSAVQSMCCLIWMSRGFLYMDQPEAARLNKAVTAAYKDYSLQRSQRLRERGNEYKV